MSTVPGVENSTLADFEVVGSLAYEVNDVLQVGAGVRIGYGLFDSTVHNQPLDATVNMSGLGLGGVFGVMVHPMTGLQIGASYRTPMSISYAGGATVQLATPTQVNAKATVTWPQVGTLGASYRPPTLQHLRVAVEGDYYDWSSIPELRVDLSDMLPSSILLTRFHQAFAVHAGAEYLLTQNLALRGGATWDSNAIPDITANRVFMDGDKYVFDVGASYMATSSIRLDAAADVIPPLSSRDVPDNASAAGCSTPTAPTCRSDLTNSAPGKYTATVVTLMFAGAYVF
jgi:long-subunit fatty acid transport protein